MEKIKKQDPYKEIRRTFGDINPATKEFRDKSKYDRKEKHKKDLRNIEEELIDITDSKNFKNVKIGDIVEGDVTKLDVEPDVGYTMTFGKLSGQCVYVDSKKFKMLVQSNSVDEAFYRYDDESDFDDECVHLGDTFIEDGKEYKFENSIGDSVVLDFDKWQIWKITDVNTDEELYCVVDPDNSFVDMICDSKREAIEFLDSKVYDWEEEGIEDTELEIDYDDFVDKEIEEDYNSDHTVTNTDDPRVQELIRIFPSSEHYFNAGRVYRDRDEFYTDKYNSWYNESTYDALEKAGYRNIKENDIDPTYGVLTNGEWVVVPIASSYGTVDIYPYSEYTGNSNVYESKCTEGIESKFNVGDDVTLVDSEDLKDYFDDEYDEVKDYVGSDGTYIKKNGLSGVEFSDGRFIPIPDEFLVEVELHEQIDVKNTAEITESACDEDKDKLHEANYRYHDSKTGEDIDIRDYYKEYQDIFKKIKEDPKYFSVRGLEDGECKSLEDYIDFKRKYDLDLSPIQDECFDSADAAVIASDDLNIKKEKLEEETADYIKIGNKVYPRDASSIPYDKDLDDLSKETKAKKDKEDRDRFDQECEDWAAKWGESESLEQEIKRLLDEANCPFSDKIAQYFSKRYKGRYASRVYKMIYYFKKHERVPELDDTKVLINSQGDIVQPGDSIYSYNTDFCYYIGIKRNGKPVCVESSSTWSDSLDIREPDGANENKGYYVVDRSEIKDKSSHKPITDRYLTIMCNKIKKGEIRVYVSGLYSDEAAPIVVDFIRKFRNKLTKEEIDNVRNWDMNYSKSEDSWVSYQGASMTDKIGILSVDTGYGKYTDRVVLDSYGYWNESLELHW